MEYVEEPKCPKHYDCGCANCGLINNAECRPGTEYMEYVWYVQEQNDNYQSSGESIFDNDKTPKPTTGEGVG